jgi:hypothetical protein
MRGFMFIDRDDLSSGHITNLGMIIDLIYCPTSLDFQFTVLKAFTRQIAYEGEVVLDEGQSGEVIK